MNECAVCLDELPAGPPTSPGGSSPWVALPCGHELCRRCAPRMARCPLCRRDFDASAAAADDGPASDADADGPETHSRGSSRASNGGGQRGARGAPDAPAASEDDGDSDSARAAALACVLANGRRGMPRALTVR